MTPQQVNAHRLWAGGGMVAVVAALLTVAGILVAEGLFGVPVLAAGENGEWTVANTALYPVASGVSALGACAVLHLLLRSTPRPTLFFAWIMALATLIVTVLPLTQPAAPAARAGTAALNLVVGVVVTALLRGVAGTVRRPG